MDIKEGKPVFEILDYKFRTVIDPDRFENAMVSLRKNTIFTNHYVTPKAKQCTKQSLVFQDVNKNKNTRCGNEFGI